MSLWWWRRRRRRATSVDSETILMLDLRHRAAVSTGSRRTRARCTTMTSVPALPTAVRSRRVVLVPPARAVPAATTTSAAVACMPRRGIPCRPAVTITCAWHGHAGSCLNLCGRDVARLRQYAHSPVDVRMAVARTALTWDVLSKRCNCSLALATASWAPMAAPVVRPRAANEPRSARCCS